MNRGARIFVLEDELMIRVSMRWALEEAGFEVTAAETAHEARRLLQRSESFDLLILNIKLPDGDGLDLCRELRRKGFTCPVLVESAFDVHRVMRRAVQAGASDYLSKPFSPSELVERVKLLLDFPRVASEVTRPSRTSNANMLDLRAFVEDATARALASLLQVRPLPGTYPDHPEVDERPVPTVPLTEEQADGLRELLLGVERFLAGRSHDDDERSRLAAGLISFAGRLSAWLGGRGTVVTDELLKTVVRWGVPAYVAYVMGLRDVLHQIALAMLTSNGVGH